jgi:hypothetical protein
LADSATNPDSTLAESPWESGRGLLGFRFR